MMLTMGVSAGPRSPGLAADPRLRLSRDLSLFSTLRTDKGAYRLKSMRRSRPAPASLKSMPYAKEIEKAAHAATLDPVLVHALIRIESNYQQHAVSAKGAVGLMQVLPATAARYGVRNAAKSPQANLKAGTLYLRDLMDQFDQRLDLALAAYNAGEGAVVKYAMRIPPYPETQDYVTAVLAQYRTWDADRRPTRTGGAAGTGIQATYLPGTRLVMSFPPRRE